MKIAIAIGIMARIGNNIRKIRQQKELNVKKVCDDLELSPAAYGNIERGLTDISLSRIIQLSQYFDVHLSTLLDVNEVANCSFPKQPVPKETDEVVMNHLLGEIFFLRTQNEWMLKRMTANKKEEH